MRKQLSIDADDFGLTAGVNQSILAERQDGLINSTSLPASGEAFAWAAGLSRQAPRLGVGIHLNVTQGKPVAPASSIPSLSATS